MTQKQAWGEDRVYFRDKSKRLHHVPLGWTSVAPLDSFKTAADGRCRFRTEDLLRMADLADSLKGGERLSRKDNNAAIVKKKTPSRVSMTRGIATDTKSSTRGKRRQRQRRSR